mmetsp:Transcript_35957/g.103402  ORF Transcript_35957/g.103402 Transcript_35957/m.103402 type:complete len:377 (+) Transcript_35957:83-1213(+)
MPLIGLIFELEAADTLPGESVCVLGNRPELGDWTAAPGRGAQLCTNAFLFPRWTASRTVWLECPCAKVEPDTLAIKYKYIVTHPAGAGGVRWEELSENRQVEVPLEPNSLWLVTDAQFGCLSPPRVSRTTMLEVKLRWTSFMPDWFASPKLARLDPDCFQLSPRASGATSDIGSDDGTYDIESEFSALSPGRACRTLFLPPCAPAASSPGSSRLEMGADEAEALHVDYSPSEEDERVVVPRAEYAALMCEVRRLREQNTELRKTVHTLTRTSRHGVQAATERGGDVATTACHAPRPGDGHQLSQVFGGSRSKAAADALYYRREKLPTSGASSPGETLTPTPQQASQRGDGGDVGFWFEPGLHGSRSYSLQEPQEEP